MAQVEEIEIKDESEEELEEPVPFKYSITSYGADYPVDGLVRRLKDGSIYIPEFQRGYIWPLARASRFVESLLMGLPVPGIFLSREDDTQKLLVIDGQQRLRTLQYFYDGIFADTGREFALTGVDTRFEGSTYKSLSGEDRRRLDDSILHATIVRQDEPSEDNSSIYKIFERLNTGGLQLSAQEIRSCIYHGEFNDLIKGLNSSKPWRSMFGPVDKRMRDQELILRFLALYFKADSKEDAKNDAKEYAYEKPMKDFLNTYMSKNRHLQLQSAEQIRNVFIPTITTIQSQLGKGAFTRQRGVNAAIFDSVMVGIARRRARGEITNYEMLQKRHKDLLESGDFIRASETHTSDEENVRSRIKLATEAFADLQ